MTSTLNIILSLILAFYALSGPLVEAKGDLGASIEKIQPYVQTTHGFKTHSIGSSHRFKSKSHRLHPSHISSSSSNTFEDLTAHLLSPSRLRALSEKNDDEGGGGGGWRKKTAFGWVEDGVDGSGEIGEGGLLGGVAIAYQGSPELWDDLTDEPVYITTTIDFVPAIPLSASPSSGHNNLRARPTMPAFLGSNNVVDDQDLYLETLVERLVGSFFGRALTTSAGPSISDNLALYSTDYEQENAHPIPRTVEELLEAGWTRTSTAPPSSPPRAAIGSAKIVGIGKTPVSGRDESVALVLKASVLKGQGRRRGREIGLDFKRSVMQL